MTLTFKKAALSLAVASTLAISGCGGSSSSDTPSNPPQPPAASATTVSGAAIKGIVRSAEVTAHDLDQNDAIVGTATTDKNGEYEISLSDSYSGGPLKIIVAPTSESRMVCDALSSCGNVNKGDELKLPQNFRLSAVTANTKGQKTVSAPVTAWTTIAAKRVEKLISEGKSPAGAAGIANAEVSLAAGFDIERTQAKSITSADISTASGDQRKAALMNAVVAEAIFKPASAGGDVDFVASLNQLASAFEDGVLGAEDESNEENALKQALASAADVVAKDPQIQSSFSKEVESVAERQVALAKAEPLAVKDQVSQDETDYTGDRGQKIESFKNFVADVRSWARAIEGQDSDALAAAVKVDQATVKNIFKSTTEGQFEFVGLAVDSAFNLLINSPEDASSLIKNGGSRKIDVLTEGGQKVGELTVTFSDYQGGVQVRMQGAAVDAGGKLLEPLDLTLSTDIPVDLVANPYEADSVDLIVKKLATQSNIIASGTIGASLIELKNTKLNLTLNQSWVASSDRGLFDDSNLDAEFNSRFVSARFSGGMAVRSAAGDQFDGNVDLELVRLGDAGAGRNSALSQTRVSLKSFGIDGFFKSSDLTHQFEASARLNVRNADRFDVVAWADYSRQVRPVTVSVPASEVAGLIPETAIEPVIGYVEVSPFYGYSGQVGSWGNAFYATKGSTTRNLYNLNQQQLQVVKTALVDKLADTYAGGFIIGSQGAGGELSEQTVSAADLLTGTELNYWDTTFSNSVSESIPKGEVYAIGPGTRELVGQVSEYWSGARVFSMDLPPQLTDELIAAVNPTQFLVDDAQPDSYGISSYGGDVYGYVSYTLPVSRGSFNGCVENPNTALKAYTGYVDGSLSGFSTVINCAEATLEGVHLLSEADNQAAWNQAETKGIQQLKDGLHESVKGQVTPSLWNAYVMFGEVAGDEPAQLELNAEFPDLEAADYFLEGSIALSASVQMPELPEASVALTLDRSSQKGGEVEAKVNWNGGNYTAVVRSQNFEDLQGADVVTAQFSNAEGYRLILAGSFDENGKLSNLTGDAYVKDADIGDVEYREGRPVITYPNGTVTEFETLF
ncbi:hypothetical protein [Marinobacter salexigens]|uniref:hypothetical protein n=1 Tax=Marinobacter salexigens TaxID=1925763 RepID=UPI000C28973F|nr:hypothetical protein [Marinobacter salexigens]